MLNIQEVVIAAKKALPPNRGTISLHEPCFKGNEQRYVKDCLDSGWVSSVGKYVDQFEKALAEYTGSRYAVVAMNGTAALHMCLLLAGVKPGDEVLIPTLTFIATANAVSYCGAIPHLVDSEERTLGICPRKLLDHLSRIAEVRSGQCFNRETGRPIRAIVPMHTFGHPVDIDAIQEICGKFKIPMIEDAAESLGSLYKGKHTGTYGLLSALSFNGNKVVTTGGGGAILTQDEGLAKLAKHLTTTAKRPHAWEYYHDHVGYNYRLPNINAALGCAQLEQLPEFLRKKRELFRKYAAAFREVRGVRLFEEPEFAQSNYWLNTLVLERPDIETRNQLLQAFKDSGILTRPVWNLMHLLPMYSSSPRMDLSVAESLSARIVNIPSSAFLV